MASLRRGTRKDGSTYVQVLYRLDGKQTSTSFEDMSSAAKFQKLSPYQRGLCSVGAAHGWRCDAQLPVRTMLGLSMFQAGMLWVSF